MHMSEIVDLTRHPLGEASFRAACRRTLDENGALVLESFVLPDALTAMHAEADAAKDQAYFCTQNHSVYLTPPDARYHPDHPVNRQVESSKGCICDDAIGPTSPLRLLYNDDMFRTFIKDVTRETELHPYADPLSSINVHYAEQGQELGWHFDNSSFAITLLIQKPETGSRFEYVKDLRNADAGDMNFEGVAALLNGDTRPQVLDIAPGTLVFFRGRDSIHRVTPNESDTTRMLAVLAYNAEPGIALSESARLTFYGRLG